MIGIIGAMEEEVAELKKDMQIEETVEMAGMVFCKGTLGGKDVVIVRSGIGKVNAGICAQILVSQFGADTLINTGIAGSLDAQIDIGDMVISTDALHHDMDATVFGDHPVQCFKNKKCEQQFRDFHDFIMYFQKSFYYIDLPCLMVRFLTIILINFCEFLQKRNLRKPTVFISQNVVIRYPIPDQHL